MHIHVYNAWYNTWASLSSADGRGVSSTQADGKCQVIAFFDEDPVLFRIYYKLN
jgi:hypothetical protein